MHLIRHVCDIHYTGYWVNLLVKVHLCSELKDQGIGWTYWSRYICAHSWKTRVLGEPIGQGTFVLRVERPGYWVNLLVKVHLCSELKDQGIGWTYWSRYICAQSWKTRVLGEPIGQGIHLCSELKDQGIGWTYWSRYICAQSWKTRILGEPIGQGTFVLRVERPGYWVNLLVKVHLCSELKDQGIGWTYWSRYICAQSWKTRVLGEPIGQGTFVLRVERPGYWVNLLVKVHLCSELKDQGIGWTYWSRYICAQSWKTRVLGEPIGQGTFVLTVERPGYWVNLLVKVHLCSELKDQGIGGTYWSRYICAQSWKTRVLGEPIGQGTFVLRVERPGYWVNLLVKVHLCSELKDQGIGWTYWSRYICAQSWKTRVLGEPIGQGTFVLRVERPGYWVNLLVKVHLCSELKDQGIGWTYWSRYICAQSWKTRVLGEPIGQGTFVLTVERPGYWVNLLVKVHLCSELKDQGIGGTYWSRYICAQSWKTRVLGEPIGQGTFVLRVERPGYWVNLLVKVHLCSELKDQGIGWTYWSRYICAQSWKTRVLGEPIDQGTFVLRVERPGYWVNLMSRYICAQSWKTRGVARGV